MKSASRSWSANAMSNRAILITVLFAMCGCKKTDEKYTQTVSLQHFNAVHDVIKCIDHADILTIVNADDFTTLISTGSQKCRHILPDNWRNTFSIQVTNNTIEVTTLVYNEAYGVHPSIIIIRNNNKVAIYTNI